MAKNRLQNGNRRKSIEFIFGYDLQIGLWVANQLGRSPYKDCISIGFAYKGEIIAGVVFDQYRPPNIEISIAAISPKWASRRAYEAIFHYPFEQLGCKRLTALIDSDNDACIKLVKGTGFVHEGTLREGHPNGDAEIYGMLKTECKWINHGKEKRSKSARSV